MKHIIAALDRVRLNLAGSPVENDVERIEDSRYTLELLIKENKKCATPSH